MDEISSIYNSLNKENRNALLSYAKFLRHGQPAEEVRIKTKEPLKIPRPENETVIGALKRLRKTYPMIEPDSLLNRTAELMTAHLVHGKQASEAIDEFEILFQQAYEKSC